MHEYECTNTIINAFSNGLKVLMLEKRFSIDQLPAEFFNIFLQRHQSFKDKEALFASLMKVLRQELFQLIVVPIIHEIVTIHLRKMNEYAITMLTAPYQHQTCISPDELKIIAALSKIFAIDLEIQHDGVKLFSANDKTPLPKLTLNKTIQGWSLPQTSAVSSNKNQQDQPSFVKDPLTLIHTRHKTKLKDAKCLASMLRAIVDFTKSNPIETTLYQVATYCGGALGLSFNDHNDFDSYFIRNRYGKKKRNKDNTENTDLTTRIDFEMIYRLKALKDHGYSLEGEDTVSCLRVLAKKLSRIIYLENKEDSSLQFESVIHLLGNNEPPGDETELTAFENIVVQKYPILLFQLFKKEANNFPLMKTFNKEYIYNLARKVAVMAELLHELNAITPENIKTKELNVFSLFNPLNILRNSFIHFKIHNIFLQLSDSNKESQLIAIISKISTNLSLAINSVDSLLEEIEEDKISALKICKAGLYELIQFPVSISIDQPVNAPSSQAEETNRPKLAFISEEISYFSKTINSISPFKNNTMEHSLTLIAQYAKEIEQGASTQVADRVANLTHNNELSLEWFSLDTKEFLKNILGNIHPSKSHCEAIFFVNSSGEKVILGKVSILYERIADAYDTVSNYNAAISIYLAALNSYYLEDPIDFLQNRSFAHELDNVNITNPRTILIDYCKNLFGISLYELQLLAKLQSCYLRNCDPSAVLDIYYLISGRVSYDKLFRYRKMINLNQNNRNIANIKFPDLIQEMESFAKLVAKLAKSIVLDVNEEQLFVLLADVLACAARAFASTGNFAEARSRYSEALNLLTGEEQKLNPSGSLILNTNSLNNAKSLNYLAELAWCHYKLKQFKLAASFNCQTINAKDLQTKLRAIFIDYFTTQTNTNSSDLEHKVANHASIIDSNLPLLKKLYGENIYTILEDQYILNVYYLASIRNFVDLNIFILNLKDNFLKDYGFPITEKLTRLYGEICKACLVSLSTSISLEYYTYGLNIVIENFELADDLQHEQLPELDEIEALLTDAILIYLHHYYNHNNFLELAKLTLNMKSDWGLLYLKRVIELCKSPHFTIPHNNRDQYFQVAMQFYETATACFQEKDFELAHQYYQPAIELFSHFETSPIWARCCLYKGISLKLLTKYRHAQVALMTAIEIYEDLKMPHALEYARIHLREVNVEVDQIIAELHKRGVTEYIKPEPRRPIRNG